MSTKLISEALNAQWDAHVRDKDGSFRVVNENKATKARELLRQYILETARSTWDKLEAETDSMQDLDDQIDFEEMEGDHGDSAKSNSRKDVSESRAPRSVSEELRSMLGTTDFDLKSIFEDEDMDDDKFTDGDAEFEDLQTGYDDAGMGSGPTDGDLPDDTLGDMDDDVGADFDGEIDGDSELDFDLEATDELGTDVDSNMDDMDNVDGDDFETDVDDDLDLGSDDADGFEDDLEDDNI